MDRNHSFYTFRSIKDKIDFLYQPGFRKANEKDDLRKGRT